MRKVLVITCFAILMLLTFSPAAEAHGRVIFNFGIGIGGGYWAPPYPYYPGYYYPAPYAYGPYYYNYYYAPAPVVSYYYSPYGHAVYRHYGPVYRHGPVVHGRYARRYDRHK